MGSGLLNHLRVMVLPLPEAGWAGGGHPTGTVMARSVLPCPGSCCLWGASTVPSFPGQHWHWGGLFHAACGRDPEYLARSSHGGQVICQKQLDVDMTGHTAE